MKLFLFFLFLYSSSYGESFFGKATSIRDNSHLFTAEHQETNSNSKVIYRDSNNRIIGIKNLNFLKNNYLPDYNFIDYDCNYEEIGRLLNDNYEITIIDSRNKKQIVKNFKISDDLVIDEGLDKFIKNNFDLKSNNLDFIIPFLERKISLNLSKISENEKIIVFKVSHKINILNFFVKPIFLHYSKRDRKMIFYNGILNLSDSECKNFFANINFIY